MKAWVPTHKTGTKPSISQQNEKPLLPSAFLKCEGFLSGTGNVYSLAIDKNNQTHIYTSTDIHLLFLSEGLREFYFFSFVIIFFNNVYIFTRANQDSQVS